MWRGESSWISRGALDKNGLGEQIDWLTFRQILDLSRVFAAISGEMADMSS